MIVDAKGAEPEYKSVEPEVAEFVAAELAAKVVEADAGIEAWSCLAAVSEMSALSL